MSHAYSTLDNFRGAGYAVQAAEQEFCKNNICAARQHVAFAQRVIDTSSTRMTEGLHTIKVHINYLEGEIGRGKETAKNLRKSIAAVSAINQALKEKVAKVDKLFDGDM